MKKEDFSQLIKKLFNLVLSKVWNMHDSFENVLADAISEFNENPDDYDKYEKEFREYIPFYVEDLTKLCGIDNDIIIKALHNKYSEVDIFNSSIDDFDELNKSVYNDITEMRDSLNDIDRNKDIEIQNSLSRTLAATILEDTELYDEEYYKIEDDLTEKIKNISELYDGHMASQLSVRVPGGIIVASKSINPDYPGIDVEFVSDDDLGKSLSRPRVLFEVPKDCKELRALIYNDSDSEDYTDEIIFKEYKGDDK